MTSSRGLSGCRATSQVNPLCAGWQRLTDSTKSLCGLTCDGGALCSQVKAYIGWGDTNRRNTPRRTHAHTTTHTHSSSFFTLSQYISPSSLFFFFPLFLSPPSLLRQIQAVGGGAGTLFPPLSHLSLSPCS